MPTNIEGNEVEVKNLYAFKMGALAFTLSMDKGENPWKEEKEDPEISSDWDKGWESAEGVREKS